MIALLEDASWLLQEGTADTVNGVVLEHLELSQQLIEHSGLNPTFSPAADDDEFTPGNDVFVHIKNGGASAVTVTFPTVRSVIRDVWLEDLEVTVPAGAERMFGPFPGQYFADLADGLADISYSSVTALTIAVLKLSRP